jgi:hypothetical protein
MIRPKLEIIDSMSLANRSILTDAASLYHDALDAKRKPFLRASIDATHSGRLTNMRVYPGKHMRNAVDSFLKPVPKPILKEHRADQDAIGRVSSAEFIQLSHGDQFDFDYRRPSEGVGSGFVRLKIDIMDQKSIEQFVDGRIQQFSTRQSMENAFCSICGEDMLLDGMYGHEHQVGQVYEVGEGRDKSEFLCYVITGPLEYREASAVNMPGDAHSRINGFQIIEPQATDSASITSMLCGGDGLSADLGSLVLGVGTEFVDLLAGGSVSSKDRRKLTGKTVVAVSPSFTDHLTETEPKENNMDTKKEGDLVDEKEPDADTKDTKNTDSTTASGDIGDDSTQDKGDTKKEDVVVPDSEKPKDDTVSDHTSGLSSAALTASLEALTTKLSESAAEKETLLSKISRLEATLSEKDSELAAHKKTVADSLAEVKLAYSQQLLSSRMFLAKSDVSSIDSKEDYEAKVKEYADRTLDSLKDALSDLGPEITARSKAVGVKTALDMVSSDKVENTVLNTPVDLTDGEEDLVDAKSPEEELDNFMSN